MSIEHRLTERGIQYKKVSSNYRKNSNYPDYIQTCNSGGGTFLIGLVSAIINNYNILLIKSFHF